MKKIALLCLLTGGMALTSFAGNGKSQLQKAMETSKTDQVVVQSPPELQVGACLIKVEVPLFKGKLNFKIRLGCAYGTIK
ncbi:hypothetical protein [Thermonema rossianum]|uniref:hypothetical protein n=1 Tax=Thermonema rossianum TaxID=55505 RepID=UPI0005701290|nr:hypothetical protein [Thermonema rossianum]